MASPKPPKRKLCLSYTDGSAFNISIPTKWEALPVSKLLVYWTKLWNERHPERALGASQLELVVGGEPAAAGVHRLGARRGGPFRGRASARRRRDAPTRFYR